MFRPSINRRSYLHFYWTFSLHRISQKNSKNRKRNSLFETSTDRKLKLLSKNGNWFNHIVSMWWNKWHFSFYYRFIICLNSMWIKLQMKFTHPWTLVKRRKKVLISRSINHLRLICFIHRVSRIKGPHNWSKRIRPLHKNVWHLFIASHL